MPEERTEGPSTEGPRPLSKSRWPLTLFLIGLAMWLVAFACFGPAFKELRFLALWIPGGMIGITGISMWVIGDDTAFADEGDDEDPGEEGN